MAKAASRQTPPLGLTRQAVLQAASCPGPGPKRNMKFEGGRAAEFATSEGPRHRETALTAVNP